MSCSAHRELKNGEEGVEIAGDDRVSQGSAALTLLYFFSFHVHIDT